MIDRKKLSGNKCQCSACHEYFNSTFMFDKHRQGKYTHDTRSRYCLTPAEMEAKGYSRNENGWWISGKRPSWPMQGAQVRRSPEGDAMLAGSL